MFEDSGNGLVGVAADNFVGASYSFQKGGEYSKCDFDETFLQRTAESLHGVRTLLDYFRSIIGHLLIEPEC